MMGDGEDVRFDWRRGGAAAAGLVAALVLVAMVFLVKFANDQSPFADDDQDPVGHLLVAGDVRRARR